MFSFYFILEDKHFFSKYFEMFCEKEVESNENKCIFLDLLVLSARQNYCEV